MHRRNGLAASLVALYLWQPAYAATGGGVLGDWRTPGGAVVRVAPCGGDLCATLLQLEPGAPTRFDTQNPEASLHTRKLCGLQIGYGFHLADPNHAEDGHLYDPKSGKTYKGVMSSEGDRLALRGYVGIRAFGRTETWTRTTGVTACS
jgi:uncharacterized protein (DUF2147 family)